MLSPELADWPVMLPDTVPIVQENVLPMLAVRLMLGPEPLQTLAVVELVTVGSTFTVVAVELVALAAVQPLASV